MSDSIPATVKKRSVDLKSSLTLISTKQIVKLNYEGDFCMKWVRGQIWWDPGGRVTSECVPRQVTLGRALPAAAAAFVGASLTDTQSQRTLVVGTV